DATGPATPCPASPTAPRAHAATAPAMIRPVRRREGGVVPVPDAPWEASATGALWAARGRWVE
ncbi:hypothetical protein CXF36_10760, partial [Corynebacterium bovis]